MLSLGSYCGFLLDHGNGTVTWLYLNVFYCVHTTWDVVIIINRQIAIQWNPSKTHHWDQRFCPQYSKVYFAQGVVFDHAPLTILANYDEGRLYGQ